MAAGHLNGGYPGGTRARTFGSQHPRPPVLPQASIEALSPCARRGAALTPVSALSLSTSESGSGRSWVCVSKGLPVLSHSKAGLFTGPSLQK